MLYSPAVTPFVIPKWLIFFLTMSFKYYTNKVSTYKNIFCST
jgi:hypothetical protein